MAKKLIKLHTVEGTTIAVCAADYIVIDAGDHRVLYDDQLDYRENEDGLCVIESLDTIINLNN